MSGQEVISRVLGGFRSVVRSLRPGGPAAEKPKKVKILYSGFFDVPLAFVVRHNGKVFLFVRDFVVAQDEYADEYKVYLLPAAITDDEIKASWVRLSERALRHLGGVPINDVHFDRSRRREIDTGILDSLAV